MNTLVEKDSHIINLDAYRAGLSNEVLPHDNWNQWDALATTLAGCKAARGPNQEVLQLVRQVGRDNAHKPCRPQSRCLTTLVEANLKQLIDELEAEVNRLLGRNDEVLSLVAKY